MVLRVEFVWRGVDSVGFRFFTVVVVLWCEVGMNRVFWCLLVSSFLNIGFIV